MAGAHFDVWVADYYDYRPGKQDGSVFKPPVSCKDKKLEPSEGLRSFPGQMMALVPTADFGELPILCRVWSAMGLSARKP